MVERHTKAVEESERRKMRMDQAEQIMAEVAIYKKAFEEAFYSPTVSEDEDVV